MRRIVLSTVLILTFLLLIGCSKTISGTYTANVHTDEFSLDIKDSSKFTLTYKVNQYNEDSETTTNTLNTRKGTYQKQGNYYYFTIEDGGNFFITKTEEGLLFFESKEDMVDNKEYGVRYTKTED